MVQTPRSFRLAHLKVKLAGDSLSKVYDSFGEIATGKDGKTVLDLYPQ